MSLTYNCVSMQLDAPFCRHHHRHGTHGHYSRRASVSSATGSKGNPQYEGQQRRDPSNNYGRTTTGTNPFEED